MVSCRQILDTKIARIVRSVVILDEVDDHYNGVHFRITVIPVHTAGVAILPSVTDVRIVIGCCNDR